MKGQSNDSCLSNLCISLDLVQNDVVVDRARGVVENPGAVFGVLCGIERVPEGSLQVAGGLNPDLHLPTQSDGPNA